MDSGGTDDGIPVIRVFVSSPNDVAEERLETLTVLRRLQAWNRGRVVLVPQMWEHQPLLATAGFQQEIDRRIPPSAADIVVFILWSRLGSPLGKDFALEDGRRPGGTEWEFLEASAAAAARGFPHLLVYRRAGEPVISVGASEDDVTASRSRWRELEAFFERRFRDVEDGAFKGSFHRFASTSEFGQKLEAHLSTLLEERLGGDANAAARVTWRRSPFRGLEAYEPEHAPIYFGRTAALYDVLGRLRRQTRAGRSFVLIVGASGSGKSSLARAGLLPQLDYPAAVEPEAVRGICRRAIVRPSDRPRPLEALVAGVRAALPELEGAGSDEDLAARWARDPSGLVPVLRLALAQAAAAEVTGVAPGERRDARLVVLIDQLEELFTTEGVTADDRLAFSRAVDALARSGTAWVLATLRNDFYARLEEVPELAALKAGDGQHDLPAPDAAEIAEIVCRPAQVAGLVYEREGDTGRTLDDRIVADAVAAGRDALPLLEYALHTLYERRRDHVLPVAGYVGIEAAVRERADEEWHALSPVARAAFPHVLRSMVEVGEGAETVPTSRRAAMRVVVARPGAGELVERFVRARLFVARGEGGEATVAVAHEALLRRWPRASDQIEAEAELLRIQTRVRAQAARWDADGRPNSLLLAEGKPLIEGELLRSAGFDLDDREATFLAASRARARRARAGRRAMVGALALLALIAGALLLVARSTMREKERERAEATRLGNRARSFALAAASRDAAASDATLAYFLARKAVETDATIDSLAALLVAARAPVTVAKLLGHTGTIFTAVFSPDGSRILTASYDRTARIWDRAGGLVAVLRGHDEPVTRAAFSPDGARVLTVSDDRTARLWDLTGRETAVIRDAAGGVTGAVFSPDGTRLLTTRYGDAASLRDLAGRELVALRGHENIVSAAEFSPDGTRVVTASSDRTARLWDLSGREVAVLRGHEARVVVGRFSPDGRHVLTSSEDRTVRLWDLAGQEVAVLRGHTGSIHRAVFSPDGTRVLTASEDKTARLWDLKGRELAVLRGHASSIECVAFSPDGARIVTSSAYDNDTRLWDATGRELAAFRGHEHDVRSAAFAPGDGAVVLTASSDQSARLWTLAGDELTVLRGHAGSVMHAGFSPDGSRIVTASADSTVRVWDRAGGTSAVLGEGDYPCVSAWFTPDGTRVVTTSIDTTARVFDLTGRELAVLRGHESPLIGVTFSTDGTRVLTASVDRTARLWDLAGTELLVLRTPEHGFASALLSRDGTRILTASDDATARVFDLTGKEVVALRGHEGAVRRAVYSPDGSRILTASDDRTARLWDLHGKPLVVMRGHEGALRVAAFSPDGARILTASDDRTVRLWDLAGREVAVLKGHDAEVVRATFSPDGTRVLTLAAGGPARVWDLAGREVAVLRGHVGRVYSAVFSPDGARVLTASEDGTAQLWWTRPEDLVRAARARPVVEPAAIELLPYAELLDRGAAR